MAEKRLRDLVKQDLSFKEVAAQLRAIAAAITKSAQWIKNNLPRDERNLVLFHLLVAPLDYIDLYTQNLEGPLPVLALCTRTLFELNVRVRHVLRSAGNMKQWMAEDAVDRLELVQAMIDLAEPGDPIVDVLKDEKVRIERLKTKHGLTSPRKRETLIATLALDVGLEKEHTSLVKVFNKLVHPTSYLVNQGKVMDDHQMKNVLLIHLQLYALDLLKRITDEMGVPPELTVCRHDPDHKHSVALSSTKDWVQ